MFFIVLLIKPSQVNAWYGCSAWTQVKTVACGADPKHPNEDAYTYTCTECKSLNSGACGAQCPAGGGAPNGTCTWGGWQPCNNGGGGTCQAGKQTPDIGSACATCIESKSAGLTNAIKNLNSTLFSSCSGQQVLNYWCNGGISADATSQCNALKSGTCASACGGVTATATPAGPTSTPAGPTSTPVPTTFTAFYRVSTAPFGVSNDPEWKVYSNNAGMAADLDFGDVAVGTKLIGYAQFKSTTGEIKSFSKEIEYIGSDPVISSIECGYSPTGEGTEVKILGENFGDQGAKSKVSFNNQSAQIVSWGNKMNPTYTPVPTTATASATPTIIPTPTCTVRPACWDATPACEMPIRSDTVYCPVTPTPETVVATLTPTPVPVNLLNANMQNRTLPDGTSTGSSPDHYAINEPWFYEPGTYALSGSATCTGTGCTWDIRADEYVNSSGTPTGTSISHPNGSTFTVGSGKMFTVILQLKSGDTATFSNVRLTRLSDNATVLGVSSKSTILAKISDKLKESLAIPVFIETNGSRRAPKTGQLYCTINVTTVNFVALTACRPPANFGGETRVQIYENTANTKPIFDKKVLVGNDGTMGWSPSSALPIVEVGKKYVLIIKGPKGIAIKKEFTALPGSTILDNISLPVGDIAPIANPDNTVNALDYSELKREWNAVTDVTRAGDFNMDNRINSFDYSCMRNSFNITGAKFLTGQ